MIEISGWWWSSAALAGRVELAVIAAGVGCILGALKGNAWFFAFFCFFVFAAAVLG